MGFRHHVRARLRDPSTATSSMSRDFVSLLMGPLIRYCFGSSSVLSQKQDTARPEVLSPLRLSFRRPYGSARLVTPSQNCDSFLQTIPSDRVILISQVLNCLSALNSKLCFISLHSFPLIISVYIYTLKSSSSNPTLCRRDAFLHNATTFVRTFHPHPQPRALPTAICRQNTRELSGHGSYG